MNNTIAQDKEILKQLATKQQNEAANPDSSVWVEASAGTGKTKVLSDRVLRMLLSGIDASKILCLTYTKAAAVEMNTRISKRLGEWAIIDDDKLKEELGKIIGKEVSEKHINNARILFAKVLDTPGGIKIQTLHSFCEEILKRFPLEADIAPYFSVMDDRISNEALANISRKLILKAQDESDSIIGKNISWLTANVKELKFSQILEKITVNRNKLLQIMSQYKDIDEFRIALSNKLGVQYGDTVESALISFQTNLNKETIKQIADTLSKGGKTDIERANSLYSCLEIFDYNKYKKAFLTKENKIFSTLASKASVKIWPEIISVMNLLAQDLLILEEYFIKLALVQSTQAIMSVAVALNSGYLEFKRQNAMLDFEDLIELTRRLLNKENVSKWVLYKLDGGIDHILIDEAQDTSPNQWSIIKSITDEFFAGLGQKNNIRTVFAVGDRKQSIYSFQGADPDEFDKMFHHFKLKDKNFKKVKLDVSFRSTKAVLDSVNALFAIDEAKSGVVINNESVSHLPYRLGEGGIVKILPLVIADDNQEDVWYPPVERKIKASASLKLASLIANKIKSMVENKEILESQNRPICYRDFMVLVQRRNSFIEEFVRECKNIGVKISGVDKLKLLEQIAVQDLLSLAKFVLLPQDDLSLAEVLKSPLFGLTDENLFDLCYDRKGDSLWYRLKLNANYEDIAQKLNNLIKKADYLRPYEFFNYVLILLDGRKKFVGRLGSEAEDTLDEFINLTLNFENNHIPDLQTFMRWIQEGNIEIKRELEQSQENAVRVMTVHGSKGLQAPIVIIPDTTRLPNIKRGEDILFSEEFDMAYFPLSADYYDSTCENIHQSELQKTYDEYRRLLYVALTRAEDRLYIAGYKNKGNPDDKSWYNLCEQTLKIIGNNFNNDTISYSCNQELECEPHDKILQHNYIVSEENWLYEDAIEETPLTRPYSPSKSEEDEEFLVSSPLKDNSFYYKRGTLIHSLLQYLPIDCNFEDKVKAIDTYLEQHIELNKNMLNQIKEEIVSLLLNPEFNDIFGPNSKAEVPIIGEVDGRIISAQIDRLVITNDKVIIVDFKTNRPAAFDLESVPKTYLKQLNTYKQLLQKIYSNKAVETYILWTNTAHLMKII